jgi:hypothetical protein
MKRCRHAQADLILVLLWQFSRKGLNINGLDLTPLSN